MSETRNGDGGVQEFELGLHQMTEYTGALRKLGSESGSMEEVAQKIVDYLYEHLTHPESGEKLVGLVRLFKTHPFGDLDDELQQWGKTLVGQDEIDPKTKTLTLLATKGEQPDWNSRRTSGGHKAIPLLSEQMVQGIPMISQLVKQLGIEIKTMLDPDPEFLIDADEHTFNVFHVPTALGSPHIPAQDDFVKPCGIKSVLGYGGLLPSGDLFVVIMFWKYAITRQTADMFQPLALSTKVALLPFVNKGIFEEA
jgi:hypothetical protein